MREAKELNDAVDTKAKHHLDGFLFLAPSCSSGICLFSLLLENHWAMASKLAK